jgi:hypothetical protein
MKHQLPTCLFFAATALLLTGCLGPAVLNERSEHEPAPDPKVELRLNPGEHADVLVVFD